MVPYFIMMVGLPGSGKSTYAKKLSDKIQITIYSSDSIREELFGDENCQTDNNEVFETLHKRVKDRLKNKENVVYDATNISSKRRRAFLSELKNIPCYKKCIIMATPFDECCRRNNLRDRSVPPEVVIQMYKTWNTPYWFEGWNGIEIVGNDKKNYIYEWLCSADNFCQDNPHHTYSLGEHCRNVGKHVEEMLNEAVLDDKALVYAGYLHDCGKPFTKSFINSKGEETSTAHYYQHHCTGAYDSLFYKYPEYVEPLDVSILVNLHMMPYFWERDKEYGSKTEEKYRKIWGEDLFNRVMLLHEADKNFH